MSWEHLKAVCWLRWRLFQNRLRQSGTLNTVLTTIVAALGLVASVSMFFVTLFAGWALLPKASPTHVLFLWNGIAVAFLFAWMTGVFVELQRADAISLEKLLHFPLSPSSAFVVNYASSFVSVTLVLFLPAMIGLAIASVVAGGPSMLVVFPLVAGFVLCVTAVTYQFRGWLAALMVNQRRRRTIIASATMAFVLLAQLPNLINLTFMRSDRKEQRAASRQLERDLDELNNALSAGKIDNEEHRVRFKALAESFKAKRQAEGEQTLETIVHWTTIADIVFPPGWLALGARSAAERNVWPGLLASLGFGLLAGVSLRRSYRTTLRYYRGEFDSAAVSPKTTAKPTSKKPRVSLLERELPWIPDPAGAVALASVCALRRAPEAKMMLLSPLILVMVFGSTLLAGGGVDLPQQLRPLPAMGAVSVSLFALVQLLGNQFGFDRDGFRSFVLSPLPRRDILLGKNLAVAPVSLGIAALLVSVLQVLQPLSVTQLIATLVQAVSVYLICCIVGNYTSILLPVAVAARSMQAHKMTTSRALCHALAAVLLMVALTPVAVPVGLGILADYLAWQPLVPVYLILATVLCVGLSVIYWLVLTQQGELLQSREESILSAVAAKKD